MKQKALFTPALTASSFKKTCKFSNAPRFNLKIDKYSSPKPAPLTSSTMSHPSE